MLCSDSLALGASQVWPPHPVGKDGKEYRVGGFGDVFIDEREGVPADEKWKFIIQVSEATFALPSGQTPFRDLLLFVTTVCWPNSRPIFETYAAADEARQWHDGFLRPRQRRRPPLAAAVQYLVVGRERHDGCGHVEPTFAEVCEADPDMDDGSYGGAGVSPVHILRRSV